MAQRTTPSPSRSGPRSPPPAGAGPAAIRGAHGDGSLARQSRPGAGAFSVPKTGCGWVAKSNEAHVAHEPRLCRSSWPRRSPRTGAAPRRPQSRYASSYVRWRGRGAPWLSGSSSGLGRRRGNQPSSAAEPNWRRASWCCPRCCREEPGTRRTGGPSASRQRPPAPSAPCGTRLPGRTRSTRQRSVVPDVGESPPLATWAPIQA